MTYSQPSPPDDDSLLQPSPPTDSAEIAQRESPLHLLSPLNSVKSAYCVLREIREICDIYSDSDEYKRINRMCRSPLEIPTIFCAGKPSSSAVIHVSAVRLKHYGALEYSNSPLHKLMNYLAQILNESDQYPAPTQRGWTIGANAQREALPDEQALDNLAPRMYEGMDFMRQLINCFPEKYPPLFNRTKEVRKDNIVTIFDYLHDQNIKRLSILRDDVEEVDPSD